MTSDIEKIRRMPCTVCLGIKYIYTNNGKNFQKEPCKHCKGNGVEPYRK